MVLELEAGADAAAMVLGQYSKSSRSWDVAKAGLFWNAVAVAHGVGRMGDRQHIAVIDSAFDLSYEALHPHRLAWPNPTEGSLVHGTVVALLIAEVAPAASVSLYPCRVGRHLDSERVAEAIDDAVGSGASIINLSMGEYSSTDALFDEKAFYDADLWQDMTSEDRAYWWAARVGAREYREWLRIPPSPLTKAAERATRAGVTVVAAAGNHDDMLAVPAMCPDVIGVGFHSVLRTFDGGTEVAASGEPTYTPSDFTDIAIIQPEDVVGSSFACPLLAGFAALVRDQHELDDFVRMARLGGMASELFGRELATNSVPTPRQRTVVDKLYADAYESWPHAKEDKPCAECALLAAPGLINDGLRKLLSGLYESAYPMLAQARAVSPYDPDAAANLGMCLGALADTSVEAGRKSDAETLIQGALHHMAAAAELRPNYPPYRERVDEFRGAAADVMRWRIKGVARS